MRTLVISDLHLGSRTDADVLRRDGALEELAQRLLEEAPDRLVLLGDLVELRHGPVIDALEAARPVIGAIGEALRPQTEVVLVPGNHDHELIGPWLERRALRREPPLTLEERADPQEASEAAARLALFLEPAVLSVAYPGVWLRDDVYATHGHFLDRHLTVPTFERLAAGVMTRVVGKLPEGRATPSDYEAALAPLYAWLHLVARHTQTSFGAERQRGTQGAWRMLTAKGPRPLKHRAIAAAWPVAVRGLNRLGLGPVHHDLSAPALRRAGLAAMGEVTRRLGIEAEHVIFGHTHRAGPLPQDDPGEWRAGPRGPRLINSGSWVHEEVFLDGQSAGSPYWPGRAVEVVDDAPPRLIELLPGWAPPTG